MTLPHQSPTSGHSLFMGLATEFLVLVAFGVVVALVFMMVRLLVPDSILRLDRPLGDLLMQHVAIDILQKADPGSPRFVYVDIGEATREKWRDQATREKPSSCGVPEFMTPRDKLASLIDAVGRQSPRLVVVDIELGPLSSCGVESEHLADSIRKLACKMPVIVVRPMVIDWTAATPIATARLSILNTRPSQPSGCSSPNLWFASSLVEEDTDGVVRSVPEWHLLAPDPSGASGTQTDAQLASVGFLGAALLDPKPDPIMIACLFPASKPGAKACLDGSIVVGGRTYKPDLQVPWKEDRILFALPFDIRSRMSATSRYPFAPWALETIEVDGVGPQITDKSRLLDLAVVIIGGSFLASGDLHPTPLGDLMPGAMIHANAIRAFSRGQILYERDSLWVELVLIGLAALVTVVFSWLADRLSGGVRGWIGEIIQVIVITFGLLLAGILVFVITLELAYPILENRWTALATLTPALLITFDGFFGLVHRYEHKAQGLAPRFWRSRHDRRE